MLRKFIERPVLSTAISLVILILGGLAYFSLPITLFPDIAPPSVQVTATYPGANSEVVARAIATPLEEAINGVEDMTYMTSNSNNDGTMTLTVYFRQGTDPDIASVNVQNRVAKAESQMPQEVLQQGISTQKIQNSMLMFVGVYSDNGKFDDLFMENYLKINVIPQIQRIKGVAQTQVLGAKDYSMRLWLKPDRLAANNLTPQDVLNAVKDQNLEAAPGRLGQSSNQEFEYVMKYRGKLDKKEDYENIVIKANNDGSKLLLKDVARVELGSITYTAKSKYDGQPAAGFYIMQTAKSNANEILTTVENELNELNKVMPKGMKAITMYNSKSFLDAAMFQVKETLIIAFILVFLVVYLFLQDFRSTLIPAIAVPVAIIGTFFFLQLFGFTINLLTMFALVLAIGIVVDDAIVVVEAVHAKMEHKDMSARKATVQSMSEISGAIISITLVMSAVFVPVAFMEGPSGVFYRQFALTLAMAILISAVNALTLSPALCALFLKSPHKSGEKVAHDNPKQSLLKRFFIAFNAAFNAITQRYISSIRFLIRRKWVAVGLLVLITVASVIMIKRTPAGFIPTEDQDFVVYSLNTPPGSSAHRTERASLQIDSIINSMPAKKHLWDVNGFNFISGATSSPYAVGFIHLKPPSEREGMGGPNEIAAYLMQQTSKVKDANAFFFNFPTVQGFGNVSGFEFMLQDRSSGSLDDMAKTAQAFTTELMKRKEIGSAFTTFAANNPQYSIDVDNFKAKQLGVSVSDLLQAIQIYYGSGFVSDFNRFGKYYRVMAQADVDYRTNETSLDGIMVRNKEGEMVPVNTLVTLKRVYGPETVTRNNLFNSAAINGVPAVGYSTGDAINAIEEVAAKSLPRGYAYEWTGMTREEKASEGQSAIIFLLSIVFVYILLSAQYESYLLPLSVILSIPTGIFGVFLFVGLAGLENNIYVQVGLIMLIGLLAKNAILIVEFAVQRRARGMSIVASALQAARLRLRPILMTSFAFIVGMLPLMFVKGAAAIGNHSIGFSTVGGMLTGVVLGIFIIPVLYIIFQYLHEKVSMKKELDEELEAH